MRNVLHILYNSEYGLFPYCFTSLTLPCTCLGYLSLYCPTQCLTYGTTGPTPVLCFLFVSHSLFYLLVFSLVL